MVEFLLYKNKDLEYDIITVIYRTKIVLLYLILLRHKSSPLHFMIHSET